MIGGRKTLQERVRTLLYSSFLSLVDNKLLQLLLVAVGELGHIQVARVDSLIVHNFG